MTSVRERLAELGLAAHRSRGQNFLVDPAVADRIVAASGLEPDELAVEIGTGLGLLTEALAARAHRVLTIEVDAGLVRAVRDRLPPNVELLHADALALDLRAELERRPGPARVVANLPYAISSPLLRRLLDLRDRLRAWVVLLQREVAKRLLARPGSRDYGSLTVLHALTARVESAFEIPPGGFHPRPRVVSTLVRVIPLTSGGLSADELGWMERVARAAFGQRRKTLANALRAGLGADEGARVGPVLGELGIEPRARAEVLTPEQLLAMARRLRGSEE